MGMFLNSRIPFDAYKATASGRYFVDKSDLIEELFPALGMDERFFCFTRPRRFGKSVMANMVGAFFEKGVDAQEIFHILKISQSGDYQKHLNKHNLIYIDMSRMPKNSQSYASYIDRIQDELSRDLAEAYPQLELNSESAVWDSLQIVYSKTNDKFIFVLDEWDAIFHKDFITENEKKSYLDFLRNLLKNQVYVELAYMTGVLPIAKYSSGSELNMFLEYDMATKMRFSEYFGFDDSEVDVLFETYRRAAGKFETYRRAAGKCRITREDLARWYDGYHTAGGERLYNPRSVVCALTNDQISNYWTSSGPYDEIFFYIRNNIDEIRDDIALMVSGEHIEIRLDGYSVTDTELRTKNQIYSAMVVYGLLTYDREADEVFIPNRELMERYKNLLMSNESLGYVHRLAKESARMLKATLAGDTVTMAEILKFAHDTESPILSYNNEIELSAVVNLVYLAARDKYRVEREDKAGEGYVDFIFYPERKGTDAFILELKVDSSPEAAIQQIKDKNYALRFKGKLGEMPNYTGRILAVGISYDKKTKAHSCKVEVID